MTKILVPVDGSEHSLRAVLHAAARAAADANVEIHLLNAQAPMPQSVTTFVDRAAVDGYHREQGDAELKTARATLDKAGIKYKSKIAIGAPAEAIASYAEENGCDEVVMGARGLGSVLNLLLGSTTTKLLHLVKIPVTIVK